MKNKFEGYVIFSDLDGTLLNDEKQVSMENKEAIKYFIDNGGKFSIATGRAIKAVEKYIENVEIDLPIITYNGGILYDYNKKKAIKEKVLESEKKSLVYKIAEDYKNIAIEIYSDENIYVFKDNGMSDRPATRLLNMTYDIPGNILDLNWNKILLVGELEVIDRIEDEFQKKYNTNIIRSGAFYLEIMPDNTSKGHALNELIRMYNLDKEKVIGVGDDMNDAELLMESGIPFCPENASEKLKKYAKHITTNNNNNIILHIVNWIEERVNKFNI